MQIITRPMKSDNITKAVYDILYSDYLYNDITSELNENLVVIHQINLMKQGCHAGVHIVNRVIKLSHVPFIFLKLQIESSTIALIQLSMDMVILNIEIPKVVDVNRYFESESILRDLLNKYIGAKIIIEGDAVWNLKASCQY